MAASPDSRTDMLGRKRKRNDQVSSPVAKKRRSFDSDDFVPLDAERSSSGSGSGSGSDGEVRESSRTRSMSSRESGELSSHSGKATEDVVSSADDTAMHDPAAVKPRVTLEDLEGGFKDHVAKESLRQPGETIESIVAGLAGATQPFSKTARRLVQELDLRPTTRLNAAVAPHGSDNARIQSVYVTNLAPRTTTGQLAYHFARHGADKAFIPTPLRPGNSRVGRVELPDVTSAKQAIIDLHGKLLHGQALNLSLLPPAEAAPAPPPKPKLSLDELLTKANETREMKLDDINDAKLRKHVTTIAARSKHPNIGQVVLEATKVGPYGSKAKVTINDFARNVTLEQRSEPTAMTEASVTAPQTSPADYGQLARDAAAMASPNHEVRDVVLLQDVDEEEQKLQARYYRIIDKEAPVKCRTCSALGHLPDDCPSRVCTHCGAFDKHNASACPQYKKCRRCRQRGHPSATCKNRPIEGGGPKDPCDVCGATNHVEEECSQLWRSFKPAQSDKKMPASKMLVSCYNCGNRSHFGDDCPDMASFMLRKVNANRVWSEEWADQFIQGGRMDGAHERRSGHGWQMDSLSGARD